MHGHLSLGSLNGDGFGIGGRPTSSWLQMVCLAVAHLLNMTTLTAL